MTNYNTDGFLSVCIPTYNRSERLIEIVNELLKFEHADFRVVITDNNSTDDTYDKVNSLFDSRIVYIKNEINIGTAKNLIQAHINGVSKYNLLLIDKDKFDAKYIHLLFNKLLELESDFEMARLLYTCDKTDYVAFKRLDNLYERLSESALVMHPSAYLFSNNFIDKNHQYFSHLLKLDDWEPLYPHNLILLSFIETIDYMQILLPRSADPVDKNYFRSLKFNYSSSYRPPFAGNDRFLLVHEFSLHLNIVDNLNISSKLKKYYLTKLTQLFLKKVTIIRRWALMNPIYYNYHNVEPMKMGLKSMVKEGFFFINSIHKLLNGKYRLFYSGLVIKSFYSTLFLLTFGYLNKIRKYLS